VGYLVSGQPALLAYLRRTIRGKAAEASAQSHCCWLAAAFLMHKYHRPASAFFPYLKYFFLLVHKKVSGQGFPLMFSFDGSPRVNGGSGC
jgi:hypothetical protein